MIFFLRREKWNKAVYSILREKKKATIKIYGSVRFIRIIVDEMPHKTL